MFATRGTERESGSPYKIGIGTNFIARFQELNYPALEKLAARIGHNRSV